MNAVHESITSSEIAGYLQVSVENVCRSIEARVAPVVAAAKLPAEEQAADFPTLSESGVWMRFTTGDAAEQAFLLSATDAVRLARVLRKEAPDGPAGLDQEHFDDLVAVFSEAVQATTRPLVARLEREVRLDFAGGHRPTWVPAAQATFRLVVSPDTPVFLCFLLNQELVNLLQSIEGHRAPARSEADAIRAPSASTEVSRDANIDLLMDVELEVSLRFGGRQLLLKEVLDLGPGSLIELDQQVQDPVELLVGKKVVARGDVVVVDGNYGLRVTEIASPRERIESLEK